MTSAPTTATTIANAAASLAALQTFLSQIRRMEFYEDQIVHTHVMPPRAPLYVSIGTSDEILSLIEDTKRVATIVGSSAVKSDQVANSSTGTVSPSISPVALSPRVLRAVRLQGMYMAQLSLNNVK
jgi:hypothetical protein